MPLTGFHFNQSSCPNFIQIISLFLITVGQCLSYCLEMKKNESYSEVVVVIVSCYWEDTF